MNNRTIKTTVSNMLKGMEIAREIGIKFAIKCYKDGDKEEAEAAVKRYNKQFREASEIAATLCILSADNYTENISEFLDIVQRDLNNMYISFIDDVKYEVDKENWE